MLGLFKIKSEKNKLDEKFKKLITEWYRLSTINKAVSDKKYAEAQQIARTLNTIKYEAA